LDGEKTISSDGTVIKMTDTSGRVLTKTFTDSFGKSTSVLTGTSGATLATLVKTFATDGSLISTTLTIN